MIPSARGSNLSEGPGPKAEILVGRRLNFRSDTFPEGRLEGGWAPTLVFLAHFVAWLVNTQLSM